jgi:hypothetical protein
LIKREQAFALWLRNCKWISKLCICSNYMMGSTQKIYFLLCHIIKSFPLGGLMSIMSGILSACEVVGREIESLNGYKYIG